MRHCRSLFHDQNLDPKLKSTTLNPKPYTLTKIGYAYVSDIEMAANMSPMEILFSALKADHVPTSLEAASALWGMLQVNPRALNPKP